MSRQEDRIAERAYEIWLERGCPKHQDKAIWLAAERETCRWTWWYGVRVHIFDVVAESSHGAQA